MLEDILESNPESSILSFLLLAPVRSFSVRELSERLGVPEQKLAIALGGMSKLGQLKSVSRAGKKYYILNEKYKLFPEIKASLLKNRSSYEDELFGVIKKLGEVRSAFLSGLFTGYPELPVDILLVGTVNASKLQQFVKGCELMMEQEINYSVMSVEEFMLRRDTFDRFLKDVFDYPHIVVFDTLLRKKSK